MKIVILAGGRGTRLWPISRNSKPKQIVPLWQGKTLIEETLARLEGKINNEDIYLLIGEDLLSELLKTIPNIKDQINILVEPGGRDTGPAMAWASAFLNDKFPDEPLLFLASDHYIRDKKTLWESIQVQEKLVKETGKLLDISIVPEFPSTALGYTQIGKLYENYNGIEVYHFLGHKEKPDFATAKNMMDEGNWLWHANFYMWTPKKFLEAFQEHAPEIYNSVIESKKYWDKKDFEKAKKIYNSMEKVSIDYAVAEKLSPENVLIVKGDFGWNDIGTWSALHDEMLLTGDAKQNVVQGKWVGIDTSNSFIMCESSKKIITTVGVDDMIVVDTEDALLICPRGRSQDVKKIVDQIKIEKGEEYL